MKYVGIYDIFVFCFFFSENSSSSHYIVLASGVDKLVTSLCHYNRPKKTSLGPSSLINAKHLKAQYGNQVQYIPKNILNKDSKTSKRLMFCKLFISHNKHV